MRIYDAAAWVLIIVGFGSSLYGCGSMEKLLPDRKKEYQYSSDIPPLEVPPDLSTSSIEDTPIRSRGSESASRYSEQVRQQQRDEVPVESDHSTVVQDESGGNYIEIDQAYPIAWRMVGRALSRLEIEVNDLDRSEGIYYILFQDKRGGDGDDTIWSSLAFWSDGGGAQGEEAFRVKLYKKDGTTEVRVLDDEGEIKSEGSALYLLENIEKKINERSSEKQG